MGAQIPRVLLVPGLGQMPHCKMDAEPGNQAVHRIATLECELLERCRLKNQTEARLAVFDYIEGWYNPHRRHSAIGYDSPTNYEKRPCLSMSTV